MSKKTKAWIVILLGVVLISSLFWMQRFTGKQAHQLMNDEADPVAAARGSSVGPSAADGMDSQISTADFSDGAGDSSQKGMENALDIDQAQEKGLRVFGTVILASNGEPVAGAWVKAMVAGDVLESETDAQGYFEIGLGAYAGASGRLTMIAGVEGAYSNNRPEEFIEFSQTTKEIGPLELELVDAHLLQVRVRDGNTQQPIAGAQVSMFQLAETITDDRGMAQIFLPNHGYLQVKAKGYGTEVRELWPQGQGPTQLTIDLAPGLRVIGTVHDDKGNPVADMRVACSKDQVTSEADGRFDLGYLGEGNQILVTQKLGYRPLQVQFNIDLVEDQPQKVLELSVVKLDDEDVVRIKGICVDEQGMPLAGVEVGATSLGRGTMTVMSDDSGQFELETRGLERTTLWAYKPGFAKHTQSLWTRGKDEVEARVVLGQEYRLAGRVINREGEPINKAMWVWDPEVHVGGNPNTRGFTDTEGRFEIVGADKTHGVVFSHPSYQTHRISAPLSNNEAAEIVLQPAGVFRGKVIEAKGGDPVSSFRVVVIGEDEQPVRQILSGDGLFEQPARKLGQVASIRVTAEGFQSQTLEMTAQALDSGDKPTVFELTRADLLVVGIVQDHQRRPWPGVQITLLGAGDPEKIRKAYQGISFGVPVGSLGIQHWGSVISDAQGRFRFEEVSPEVALGLVVQGTGVATELTLGLENFTDEQLKNLRITVTGAGGVQGRVSGKEFPDARGVYLASNSGENPVGKRQLLSSDRTFNFESLPPGPYILMLNDGSHRQLYNVRKQAQVAAGEVAIVNFGEDDGAKLSGMAFMSGRALENGAIYLMKEGVLLGDWRITQTDSSGLFQFEGVAPGTYHIVAYRRDYGLAGNPHNHPNRVVMTQEESDQFREYAFRGFGSVRGRYTSEEPTSFRLIGKTNEGIDYSRWLEVRQGSFEFPEMPPGIYALMNSKGNRQHSERRTLVREIIVPDDGSDVDLGDVGLGEEATLTFHPSGEEGALTEAFSLEVRSDQGDSFMVRRLSANGGSRELQVVPGVYSLHSRANGPFLASINPANLVVEAGDERAIQVRLRPVTELKFTSSNKNRILESARILYADGKEFSIRKGERVETDELQMSLTEKLGYARNLPAGPCQLIVVAEDGLIWEGHITLSPGNTQHLQVFLPHQKMAGIP